MFTDSSCLALIHTQQCFTVIINIIGLYYYRVKLKPLIVAVTIVINMIVILEVFITYEGAVSSDKEGLKELFCCTKSHNQYAFD